jgi:hypothetical protein
LFNHVERTLGADYDEVRQIWNAMIDRRPALIARCRSPEDVVQAVKFARKHNLLVSVRGGGHNIAGNAVCDDGLMIDLSLMKRVQVDPGRPPGGGRARLHPRRLRRGRAGPRPRHAAGHQLDHRRGRPDARRRLRLVEPEARHDRRQPALRGCRDGGWQSGARQRNGERRPVLGRCAAAAATSASSRASSSSSIRSGRRC